MSITIIHSDSFPTLKETLSLVEKQAIINALQLSNGNKLEASKLLGIGKTSLYDKCKQYNIK
ncbi:helix-turn-helix domain-containing protein [Heyndrickxia sporothermodurans]|uniref:helix-turn-helix domain-containing protein n=1 Tax=Heyndrickxia sporothermodurans TaxID=46224 RepID=UPI0036852EB7